MLISASILVLVAVALWQFSFAFCRSLLTTYSQVELSGRVEKLVGLTVETIEPREFDRLMVLVQVAPDPGDDAIEITAVRMYYRVIKVVAPILSPVSQRAAQWCRNELARCSYFAAITLDRRLVAAVE